MKLEPDTELLEFVCENEKDVKHFVITGQDQKEIHLDPTRLSKYAGTYELPRPGREPIIFTVTVVGDQLILDRPGMGKAPLFAQSETVFFTTIGPLIEFVSDDHGAVSHLIVRAAEGEQKAIRK